MGKFSDLARKIGKTFPPGSVIFRQGEPGDAMYLLFSGSVEVSRQSGGEKRCVGVLGAGELFGEMALVDAEPRSATVSALEETTVIPVTNTFLRENIRKDPNFIFQIIETLILRIENSGNLLRDKIMEKGWSGSGKSSARQPVVMTDLMPFLSIFKGYSDPGKYLEFEEGDVIFREDDQGDLMFIILDGSIKVTIEISGKERELIRMDRGDFFGESALITDMPRSATATALSRTVVLPVVRKELMEGIIGQPAAALTLIQILIWRLRGSLGALTE